MVIYTKGGDKGETSLFGGKRVKKYELRLEVYGQIDELNSAIGMARSWNNFHELDGLLKILQEDLFIVGTELAAPESLNKTTVSEKMVKRLENEIDKLEKELPHLHHFILPSGTQPASLLHLARSICRRAERRLVELNEKEKLNPQLLIYVNRLSDLLFVLARYENKLHQRKEEEWKS